MITNKELSEVTLSPTKKDYYQIWNELMELADKISERWSPASTNESDPGVVLLKALTAIADKLNYNIDKNTLEAFMPSATQVDSMRKLTEMMGYNMQHYRSATGKVLISYKSSNELAIKDFEYGIYFPKFINLKNEDEDVNFVTLEDFTLQSGQDSREVAIIEGELLECEANNDYIINAMHLDDLNRYLLPEYAIAENGIFITNIADSKESSFWKQEQNLNTQQPGAKIYKVGFDSATQLPYVQFPADIKFLMEDGLRIKYIRTNGINGNISAKVLSKVEKPAIWATADDENIKQLSGEMFVVTNTSAISNGADPESLESAYNNYKKTIGTFDTLVTCRDYMNKIYQMTESDTNTTPLVSNVIVSDIRDDINKATPVSTFNEYGVGYKNVSRPAPNSIEPFDLVIYPFKTIYGLNNKTEYKNSFKFGAENLQKIQAELELNKTIAHNITTPSNDELACIKNYLKLKARITTTKKVTYTEEAELLNNIYKAIYANFNARKVDFGEEIPYETIVKVIKSADYRIKEVSLDEPTLNTAFCLQNGNELPLYDASVVSADIEATKQSNEFYNKLALRNVLAGKIAAFDYDNDFISEYDKTSYPSYINEYGESKTFAINYPVDENEKITAIESHFDVCAAFANRDKTKDGLILNENEVIQFRAPNFKTTKTYPAYVNYFIKLNDRDGSSDAIPATFTTLRVYMSTNNGERWSTLLKEKTNIAEKVAEEKTITVAEDKLSAFKLAQERRGIIFKYTNNTYTAVSTYDEAIDTYYYLPLTDDIFAALNGWIKEQPSLQKPAEGAAAVTLKGIYRTVGVQEKPYGRLIDADLKKYLPAYKFGAVASNNEVLDGFFIQETRENDESDVGTADGLGKDARYAGVPKDGEYELQAGEYLLINYTNSKTDETTNTEIKSVVNQIHPAGTVIRANFNLIDSALYHNNHSYSKKDNFYFEGYNGIEGMFTLGSNEQIEIREIVKVDLNEETMYLYWELNSDNPTLNENPFIFNENYNGKTNNAYTLKEGEHLYYTNSKKQDLVFYGAGTLIVKGSETPELIKYSSLGEVSEEDIMTNGLAAEIPWQAYSLSGTNKGLQIIEHQYISLTEGDMIISINGTDPTADIGNDWTVAVESAEYRFAEDEANTQLPALAITGLDWQVRSRLDFNLSKTTAQCLNKGDSLKIYLANPTTENPVVLEPKEVLLKNKDGEEVPTFVPMYVNANYTCQAAVDTLSIASNLGDVLELKLKISSQTAPRVANNEYLSLNNYVNGDAKYTKYNFAALPVVYTAGDPAFKVNTSIKAPYFGLIAIYYIEDITAAAVEGYQKAYIVAKDEADNQKTLEIFNTSAAGTRLELTPGLNIVKLAALTTSLEFYPDSAKKSTVVFGNLDVITDINSKLDYRNIDQTADRDGYSAELKQLLLDITKIEGANDFYYNLPIQSVNEIDLNTAVIEDKLSSPFAWYDPNNVNRKFVISEIDADYLATGVTLTKASRA